MQKESRESGFRLRGPPPQVIPIYSELDTEDYLIRAYTKCPTYDNILLAW